VLVAFLCGFPGTDGAIQLRPFFDRQNYSYFLPEDARTAAARATMAELEGALQAANPDFKRGTLQRSGFDVQYLPARQLRQSRIAGQNVDGDRVARLALLAMASELWGQAVPFAFQSGSVEISFDTHELPHSYHFPQQWAVDNLPTSPSP